MDTINMKLVKKDGKTYTQVRLGKKVTEPFKQVMNLYCKLDSEHNKHIKSTSHSDYYLLKGDHINKKLEG